MRKIFIILSVFVFFLFVHNHQVLAITAGITPPPTYCQSATGGGKCDIFSTKQCTSTATNCQMYNCETKDDGTLHCDAAQQGSSQCSPLKTCLYSQPCLASDTDCKTYACISGAGVNTILGTDFYCVPPGKAEPAAEPTEKPSPRLPCSSGWDEHGNLTTDRESITSCHSIETGLGISIGTDPQSLVKDLFSVILGLSGGIALILIIYSGFQLIASQGNPEKLEAARQQLVSAIVGLLFIIFALVILQVIGVDILKLPNFK